MSKEESNFKKALNKKEALKLNFEQSLALNDILQDLATESYKEGLLQGMEIVRR